jgi:Anhydro-N-acetylmuramic acid kinase
MVVAGGGAKNSFLVDEIRRRLPKLHILLHDEFGVPGGAMEAVAFALMGYDALHGRSTNLPRCTGARHAISLGKMVRGQNFRELTGRVFSGGQINTFTPPRGDTGGRVTNRIVRLKG